MSSFLPSIKLPAVLVGSNIDFLPFVVSLLLAPPDIVFLLLNVGVCPILLLVVEGWENSSSKQIPLGVDDTVDEVTVDAVDIDDDEEGP